MARRVVLLCVLLLCSSIVLGCGDDEPLSTTVDARQPTKSAVATPAIPEDAPLVVFLGDSLSAGMRLSQSEAFPAVLQRELAKTGLPFRLVNAGVSGNTTAAGLARVDWVLRQRPDVVVIQLGANDGFRGLALEATEENLRGIVAKVEAAGANALLLGMKLPPNYGADYTRGFEALYPRVARETEVSFVSFFMDGVAGVPEMNLDDGIHPTAEGHRQLAANLETPLAEVLRKIR